MRLSIGAVHWRKMVQWREVYAEMDRSGVRGVGCLSLRVKCLVGPSRSVDIIKSRGPEEGRSGRVCWPWRANASSEYIAAGVIGKAPGFLYPPPPRPPQTLAPHLCFCLHTVCVCIDRLG